jgi:hypothetical protein
VNVSSKTVGRDKKSTAGIRRANAGMRPGVSVSEDAVKATFTSIDRHRLIAEAAFRRFAVRGFLPGREVEDWLLAEQEVNVACGLIEPTPRWDLA